MSTEYYDYGVGIEPIVAPPAAEVVDQATFEFATRADERRRMVEACMQTGRNMSREKCEAIFDATSAGGGK